MTAAVPWRPRAACLLATVGAIWAVSLYGLYIDPGLPISLAVTPREPGGLVGVIAMPFVHGSLPHLLINTLPMLVFGAILMGRGAAYFFAMSVAIALLGGLALWLFGRSSPHVGASGLLFGYFGLLVVRGLYERRVSSIAVSVLVTILYGGMIWGVLPRDDHVSWEAHLLGLCAGIGVARASFALDARRARAAARD